MKKEEIFVVIDNDKKRDKAIKILTDAGISSSVSALTSTTEDSSSTAQSYKDGTYTGSGTGFRGTTKISVTVVSGKISSIKTVSKQDDTSYYNRAESTISKSIISKQSTSVDTVSGATYSSKGIIAAVENALSKKSIKQKERHLGPSFIKNNRTA